MGFEKIFTIEWLKYEGTIGKTKECKKFFKKYKRVGAISVWLLRKYLRHIKDPYDSKQIGIYVNKKGRLVPIHCDGYMLAPIIPRDKTSLIQGYENEGRI